MVNIPQQKIPSNTDRKTVHFELRVDVIRHFNAWKSLNGYKNKDDAMNELIIKSLMNGVNSTDDVLSNSEIAIHKHSPIKLN